MVAADTPQPGRPRGPAARANINVTARPAARAPAGSGFRAPGAVIDDPAAQQHPGAGGGGPSIRSPRAPGARAHQVTGPLLASGWGTRTTGDIVAVRQAGQQDRAPCDRSRARSPLGRSSLEGAATLRATPLLGQGPGPARDRSDRPHSVALTPPHPARRPRDQRHDLAGTTGHRPANQLTRQRIDRRDPDRHGHEHPVPDSCTRQAPGPPTHLGTPPPSQPPMIHEVAHAGPRPASHQTPPPYGLNKSRRRGRRPRVSGPRSPGRAPRPGKRCDRLAVPGSARHRVHSSSAPRAASSSESPRTGR